jgi:outer membrane protein assembly factor BamA
VVRLPYIDPSYAAAILASSYQASSYKDVLILGGSYSFIYKNQTIKNSRDYWFLRVNAEASGNLLSAIYSLSGQQKKLGSLQDQLSQVQNKLSGLQATDSSKSYYFLGQPFSQYVKTDFDLRYYYKLNDVSSLAYRGFFGIGLPYGNSKEVPFERQYYAGGANDIRAWQVRSLGPGSFNANPGDTVKFLNETADIKLEASAEYRYKLFWILEGALFLDAGNIWSYNYDSARPGSQFTFRNFYKEIAVGTGTGFRFDFKFVIARVDIGVKLRDPLLKDGPSWIFLNGPYKRDDFTIVLGIGYPF